MVPFLIIVWIHSSHTSTDSVITSNPFMYRMTNRTENGWIMDKKPDKPNYCYVFLLSISEFIQTAEAIDRR